MRGDETVLDAGCGTGRLTAELLEALPRGRVVGLDVSRNMLLSAKKHLHASTHVRLVAADLLHLPFARLFDGVVSTAAFHWVLDHDQLFVNLHRILVPGGWIEAQCGGGPNILRLRQRADTLATAPRFAGFFRGFREPWLFQDAEGAADTLRRAGFIGLRTSLEAAPTVLDNARQYEEFVRTIILRRHLMQLPTEELRAEFIAALTAQAGADDPPFLLDYWRLNLSGVAG